MQQGDSRIWGRTVFTALSDRTAVGHDITDRTGNGVSVAIENGKLWLETDGVRQRADTWEDAARKIYAFLTLEGEAAPDGDEVLREAFDRLAPVPETHGYNRNRSKGNSEG